MTESPRRTLSAGVLAAVLSLILGTIVLTIVNAGIELIWVTAPDAMGGAPAWYVLGVLVLAAVLVYLVRRYVGDTGHSPIGGIKVSNLTPKAYVGAILAILASLWGGVVLGPEVALVATGSMVGGVVARSLRITDAKNELKVVGLGALGAILALLVGPILTGSMTLSSAPESIEVAQLAWAIVVAAVVTVAVTIARLLGALVARVAGTGPHLPILLAAAAVIGVCGLIVQAATDESVEYVVTSGEALIAQLTAITSITTLVGIITFKTIAYAVSLGSGFRGGPFFPAMFVGAAVGLLASLTVPSGPTAEAAIVVGVVASVIATAPMRWPLVLALAVVIGLLVGTWTLVPAAVVGAVVARAIPRWGDRVTAPVSA